MGVNGLAMTLGLELTWERGDEATRVLEPRLLRCGVTGANARRCSVSDADTERIVLGDAGTESRTAVAMTERGRREARGGDEGKVVVGRKER